MNCVSKELLGGIVYSTNAAAVWKDLCERYDKIDGSHIFQLHKDIATISQGTSLISSYFSKLRELWVEYDSLAPVPGCECVNSREFVVFMHNQKLLQFLMGLNDSYEQARSQILMMVPLPIINKAYSLLVERESQRIMSQTSHSSSSSDLNALFTAQSSVSKPRVENPRNQGYGRGDRQSDPVDYHKGLNALQEQYNQILQILGQSNRQSTTERDSNSHSSANLAQENYPSSGNVTALSASIAHTGWIIDSGATNHMTPHSQLLINKHPLPIDAPRSVQLPNGDSTLITHTGSSNMTSQDIINNDLSRGRVKVIGREQAGLYLIPHPSSSTDCTTSQACSHLVHDGLSSSQTVLWHQRLGHTSSNVLARTLNLPVTQCSNEVHNLFPNVDEPSEVTPLFQHNPPTTDVHTETVLAQDTSSIRRSQRSTKAHLWLQDYVASAQLQSNKPLYSIDKYIGYDSLSASYRAFLSSFGTEVEPTSFEEACKDPRWVEAMQAEISALESNQTWQVVPLPTHKKVIGCKWIFKIKYHASGEIDGLRHVLWQKDLIKKKAWTIRKPFLQL
ncbi:uncharacterized protein [Solanum lycopersicum]|uniref:uncharacterized protein n=1 Tax=Solanum lycopersicum TaxID=4081 RepID=UPI00374A9499